MDYMTFSGIVFVLLIISYILITKRTSLETSNLSRADQSR